MKSIIKPLFSKKVITLDTFELKREQHRLAKKVLLRDDFDNVKTIGGTECAAIGNKLLAVVIVCEFPSLKLIEKQSYLLDQPLPYKIGFQAYREMPAIIEAFNKLEQEPDVLLVKGMGINHPRKFGIASHLGIALNIATIGIVVKNTTGKIEKSKIVIDNDFVGFEIKTREHANPVYAAPGNKIAIGTVLDIISKSIKFPHKLPEPMHIAHKIAKKNIKEMG
jgi:deoxyribonuclease V